MFTHLLHQLETSRSLRVAGLRGSSPAWLCSRLSPQLSCCCILPDEHQVPVFEQDLRLFTDTPILPFPGYEIPPYTPLSPDQQTTAVRLATLYQLREQSGPQVMITSIEALLRRLIPKRLLLDAAELIMAGEECDRDELLASLTRLGYEQASLVQNVGDVAVRGGILDLYPPPFVTSEGDIHDGPLRLDFFGDTVESLRPFDPLSQRSTGELAEAVLLPVHDILGAAGEEDLHRLAARFRLRAEKDGWSAEETARIVDRVAHGRKFAGMESFLPLFYAEQTPAAASLFDFLPAQMALVLIDPEAIYQNLQLLDERIQANFHEAQATAQPALPPSMVFLEAETIRENITARRQILIGDFEREGADSLSIAAGGHQLLKQEISLERSRHGLIGPLSERIKTWRDDGEQVVLCCRSSRHTKNLAELLSKHQHIIAPIEPPLTDEKLQAERAASELLLCDHPLSHGFSLAEEKLHILSESELFGEMRLGKKKKASQKGEPIRFTEINNGDIVVHRDHGLGVYQGLQTIVVQGVTNDFMLIEYRDGDRLYLPVDRLNLISRYEGLSDRQPKIDKLGTQSWRQTKSKVKEEVWKVAQELLDIYARREMQQGHRCLPPGEFYAELEESFPYDETPGQSQAITDVIGDLTSDKPMDRLVCGDVGYGKTEVAIRGAFKMVEDGRQVALLVPTTVLAEQHTQTFRERLAGLPAYHRMPQPLPYPGSATGDRRWREGGQNRHPHRHPSTALQGCTL